ncbi:MAG: hypothetical protein ACKOEY_05085, partial [Phenylobacterium sp.]
MNRRQHLLALGAGLSGLAAAPGAIARSPSLRVEPGLEWVTDAAQGPGVSFHTFGSEARGGPVSFHIYVPPDYAAHPDRRFPVVYWLHGSGGGVSG